ncbi:MAG TPA: arylsulfotransferase family protein [Solirubrobacteraceae bacterium]|nr:arylsulfotransferase family protein [Solirubrobacteraceae bacterium]
MAGSLTLSAQAVAAATVSVFPIPGSQYNVPKTQITFRGAPVSALGPIQVVGSRSGAHAGLLLPDSDGQGGSFVPSTPFAVGETVTVTTQLVVIGSTNGQFSFRIEHPAPPLPPMTLPQVAAGANGLQHFRSRPDLQPPSITVSRNSAPASNGDIFLTPQFGPTQNGPMILDPSGKVVWFQPTPISRKTLFTDFRVQSLHGQPVLTWWQGSTNAGSGRGIGVIFDQNYRQIATVHAGNGLDADLHEFLVTPKGQAYIIASAPVWIPGHSREVMDAVVQEIDIATGLVMFDWHALGHIPVKDSYTFGPNQPGHVLDPYHLNSVSIDRDGNLIVSARNTSAVYKIDHTTGHIIWTLGGKQSSFEMGPGTTTAFQHDAIVQPDGSLTMFDDGGGPPRVHKFSRGVRVSLDFKHMTARLVREYDHPPQIASAFEGGEQLLPNGDIFVGWGQQPYFTEFDSNGRANFDAHFTVPTSSYRAYRFPWNAQPPTTPALAAVNGTDGTAQLWASWNGATDVTAWRLVGGPNPLAMAPIATARRSGFESFVWARNGNPWYRVQALGSHGQVLATTRTVQLPPHLAIYSRSVFVSPSHGFGAMPVGCFTPTSCKLVTTLRSGNTVLASTGKENLGAGQSGFVYFRLSPAARSMLAHARGRRLNVTATVQDVGGPSVSAPLTLVPFSTSGSGPHRDVTKSKSFTIAGTSAFVSQSGFGGIPATCFTDASCQVQATVTVGRTTIAHTGPEFVGAHELGYVSIQLTSAGKSMLAHAGGHQLGVHVTLTGGGQTSSGDIALIPFR